MSPRKLFLGAIALNAVFGLAHAQSSLILFGKVDSAFVKKPGSDARQLDEGAQSRFGVRGIEDLGGGLSAFFWLENRFRSDTGGLTAVRFFQGQSIVGLRNGLHNVALGRDYIAGYVDVQLLIDPFIHTGISSMVQASNGGIGTVRADGAVTYQFKNDSLFFSVQAASATEPNSTTLPGAATADRPMSLAASYKVGPVVAGYSYENPGGARDKWQLVTARGTAGPVLLSAGYGRGTMNDGNERRSYLLGLALLTSTGRLKMAYGNLRNSTRDIAVMNKWAVGYNYDLSKRTFVYANVARDQALLASKAGIEIGIQHNF